MVRANSNLFVASNRAFHCDHSHEVFGAHFSGAALDVAATTFSQAAGYASQAADAAKARLLTIPLNCCYAARMLLRLCRLLGARSAAGGHILSSATLLGDISGYTSWPQQSPYSFAANWYW